VLFSNARGIYLGDPLLTPLFDELQRRAAVLFVHPNPSPDPSAHALGLPAGGTVPYLAGRFAIIDEMNVIPGAADRGTAADTFRRLYWDTALSWGDPVLRMLREIAGIDHVVFGTDYPYLRRDLAVSCRGRIEASQELTDSERTAILGGTAATLIPRLAALHPTLNKICGSVVVWNALALRAHQSANDPGSRPSNCCTVPVRNPVVSARMSVSPSTRASASAGGAPSG
jgi:aminocarboxymuconate-semialdehyde decarboxylase